MSKLQRDEILLLFDVDGTLTFPGTEVEPELEEFLYTKIKPLATIGIVSGLDLEKLYGQLNGNRMLENFDLVFPENGLVQIDHGQQVGKQSLVTHLGEPTLQRYINYVLRYLSDLKLPFKRGTFLEFRCGMLNISPAGKQCTKEERSAFHAYDLRHQVRRKMICALKKEFPDLDMVYSIGGQTSVDVFPNGWDKTYSLRYIEAQYEFKKIHFFGDKTEEGGNDYEIFNDPRTIGHKVQTPDDTRRILAQLFAIKE